MKRNIVPAVILSGLLSLTPALARQMAPGRHGPTPHAALSTSREAGPRDDQRHPGEVGDDRGGGRQEPGGGHGHHGGGHR